MGFSNSIYPVSLVVWVCWVLGTCRKQYLNDWVVFIHNMYKACAFLVIHTLYWNADLKLGK